MEIFSKMLNFTIRLFQRVDQKWGAYNKETGTWEGMVENLLNGEADMISTSFTFTSSRSEVVEYMLPISQETLGFAVKSELILKCKFSGTYSIYDINFRI